MFCSKICIQIEYALKIKIVNEYNFDRFSVNFSTNHSIFGGNTPQSSKDLRILEIYVLFFNLNSKLGF